MRGNFFAVDRSTWGKVCDLGINEAAAFLVLACGTGADNRFTSWSTQALHKYAGVSWEHGKSAIETLLDGDFVRRAQGHTLNKPRYELLSVATKKANPREDSLIWLPNSIVTGTGKGEDSPVRRLRSAGDVWALRLFVDLYHAQNLRDDGGISPQVICQCYEREQIGEQGVYKVWGFRPTRLQLSWKGPFAAHQKRQHESGRDHPAWESVRLLQQMGLLTFVPHIFESDIPSAEMQHPYGIGTKGEEPIEAEIGAAADAAARVMCPEWMVSQAEEEGYEHFCPVLRTQPNTQMIGVARLRYRPHTSRTAAWFAQLQQSGEDWVRRYQELECTASAADKSGSAYA
jgi:hypothetical protein